MRAARSRALRAPVAGGRLGLCAAGGARTHTAWCCWLVRVRRAPPRCSTHNCAADEPKEIKALYKRFRRLDRSGRGTLSNDDLQMIPEIAMNPLSARLQVLFVKDGEDRINFKSFVSALAIFSDKARPDLKTRGACPCGSEQAGGRNGGGGRRRLPAWAEQARSPPRATPLCALGRPQPCSDSTTWTATAFWAGTTCGSCWR